MQSAPRPFCPGKDAALSGTITANEESSMRRKLERKGFKNSWIFNYGEVQSIMRLRELYYKALAKKRRN